MKTRYQLILSIVIVVALALSVGAATNMVQNGDVLTISWATTGATANDPVVKGAAKATGGIIGVALTTAAAGADCSVATRGVFDLSVTATATSIGIGDYIYTTMSGVEVSTAALTNDSTGILFGQALEAIVATGTATTINVLLRQPGHL